MIYTVTFNPSLDYVISVDSFEIGKINRTNCENLIPGGKGINVSIMLKELGIESTVYGFSAGFTGETLQMLLREKGIFSDLIVVKDGFTRINVKVSSQEETEINGQGAIVSNDEMTGLINKISALQEKDMLVLAGSIPKGISQNIYANIVKLCCEKNIRVVVDASGTLLWNTLEYHPFLIKPNHQELSELFQREIKSFEEIEFYAKKLQKQGARNVLVSMGKDGALLVTEDGQTLKGIAPEGKVLNSVGAGDSMVAGFLAEYLNSGNYEKALKMGICAGSATAFSVGLGTKEAVDKLLSSE